MMVQNEKNTGRRPLVTESHTVPLWDYTIAVYRKSGVAAACLELQHSAHIDVPLFFCAGYASLTGRRFDKTALAWLCDICTPWQKDIVQPLRLIRTQLKQGHEMISRTTTEAFRTEIKSMELGAERIQIDLMQDLVTELPMQQAACSIEQLTSVLTMVVQRYSQVAADAPTSSKISFLADQMYHY